MPFGNAAIDAYIANEQIMVDMEEDTGEARVNGIPNAYGPFLETGGTFGRTTGMDGNAARMVGTQGLQATPGSWYSGKTAISCSFWLRYGLMPSGYILLGENSAIELWIYSNANIKWRYKDQDGIIRGGSQYVSGIVVDVWSHIFISHKISTTATFILMIDGNVLVNSSGGGYENFLATSGYAWLNVDTNRGNADYDAFYAWDAALSLAAGNALYNSGTGRFWTADVTAPAVPDKVVRYRMQDAGGDWHTGLTWRNPTDSDFFGAEIGRALDSAASTPTHILEDNGDGTVSWVTTGSSTDPYRLAGASADTAPLQTESDRFGAWADPDQTDDDAAFFVRSVDIVSNASAWVKAVDGAGVGGGLLIHPGAAGGMRG